MGSGKLTPQKEIELLVEELNKHRWNVLQLRNQSASYAVGEVPLFLKNNLSYEQDQIQELEAEIKAKRDRIATDNLGEPMSPPPPPPELDQITITVPDGIKDLTNDRRDILLSVLAAILQVERSSIRILKVQPGSTRVFVELPKHAVARLSSLSAIDRVRLAMTGIKTVESDELDTIKPLPESLAIPLMTVGSGITWYRKLSLFAKVAVLLMLLVICPIGTVSLYPRLAVLFITPTATTTATPTATVVHLTGASVRFIVTRSGGDKSEISAGDTLKVTPGETVVIEVNVTIDQSPFPRSLTYHYFAMAGSVPKESTGPSTSYVASEQPGSDFVTVSIMDQQTGEEITRSVAISIEK